MITFTIMKSNDSNNFLTTMENITGFMHHSTTKIPVDNITTFSLKQFLFEKPFLYITPNGKIPSDSSG